MVAGAQLLVSILLLDAAPMLRKGVARTTTLTYTRKLIGITASLVGCEPATD